MPLELDTKTIGGSIAAGALLLIGTASGYLYVSTPAAQKCEVELRECEVRNEYLNKAKDACKGALATCTTGGGR